MTGHKMYLQANKTAIERRTKKRMRKDKSNKGLSSTVEKEMWDGLSRTEKDQWDSRAMEKNSQADNGITDDDVNK